MSDMIFCAPLIDGRTICVSPVTRDTFEANKAYSLGDDFGYFIYEFDEKSPAAGIEILAKAASYEAALRLIDLYFAASSQTSCDCETSTKKCKVGKHSRQLNESDATVACAM